MESTPHNEQRPSVSHVCKMTTVEKFYDEMHVIIRVYAALHFAIFSSFFPSLYIACYFVIAYIVCTNVDAKIHVICAGKVHALKCDSTTNIVVIGKTFGRVCAQNSFGCFLPFYVASFVQSEWNEWSASICIGVRDSDFTAQSSEFNHSVKLKA